MPLAGLYLQNFSVALRLQEGERQLGRGASVKRSIIVVLLFLVAAAALTYKSWWSAEREEWAGEETTKRLAALEKSNQTLQATVDSLSAGTRERLDSVRAWIQVRAQEISGQSEAGRLELARQAWKDAKAKLPADLSAYEKKIALKEIKTTIVTWFKLSAEDWKSITSVS